MSDRSDLLRVAKRVVWFKQPEDAIKDVELFLARVMTYGTPDRYRHYLALFL
jgi:hypothetical protein